MVGGSFCCVRLVAMAAAAAAWLVFSLSFPLHLLLLLLLSFSLESATGGWSGGQSGETERHTLRFNPGPSKEHLGKKGEILFPTCVCL